MASTSHRPDVSQQSPLFYKIFQPQHNSEKLLIPQHFIQNFGGAVYKKVFLQNSEGKFWKVELEKDEGRLVMKKGWQEFVNAHNLKHGNWLLFKYSRPSVFNVKIFGLDGCVQKSTPSSKPSPLKRAAQSEEEILKFAKAFGKTLDYYIKVPVHVVRRCDIEPDDETVLRTEKGEVACTVGFQEIGGKLKVAGEKLKEFWKKINVEPGDRCEFKVEVGSDGKVKEIILVKLSRFVTKSIETDPVTVID